MRTRNTVRSLIVGGTVASVPNVVLAVVAAIQVQWQIALFVVPFQVMFVAGAVAGTRRAGNRAAHRLLVVGVLAVIWNSAQNGLVLAYEAWGGGPWFVVANTAQQILDLALATAVFSLLALYPSGTYQGRLDRRLTAILAILAWVVPAVLLLARDSLQPAAMLTWINGYLDVSPHVDSPLQIDALGWLASPLTVYVRVVFVVAPALGSLSIARRYVRSDRDLRTQIKWPLLGALMVAVTSADPLVNGLLGIPAPAANLIETLALTALPVSLAIGVVAPRLLDIDALLSRTLAYGGLWLVIGLVYVGVAAAAGFAVRGQGLSAVIFVAIFATVVFEPARRWLVGRSAMWLGGTAVDGEDLVRRFGRTLAHTLDERELIEGIAGTVHRGLAVEWVRVRLNDRVVATAGRPPDEATARAEAPLDAAGRALGSIECGPRHRGVWLPRDRELLTTLAAQSALALANARLAGELVDRLADVRRQAAELTASRARMVRAEETARRGVERDLHDGVQQELVAIISRIALARGQDHALLDGTLAELQDQAEQALGQLRELVNGIHPSVLTDRGIVGAVEARSARLPIGVSVECDAGLRARRFPEVVEGVVYFAVSEALTNVLKHARATQATVRLSFRCGELVTEIIDHGRGFDPDTRPRSGLDGLIDRVTAVDGTLHIVSEPGSGTRVTVVVPAQESTAAAAAAMARASGDQ